MCGGPLEYITYVFVPASPAVSCMSGSSNLNSFRDRRQCGLSVGNGYLSMAVLFSSVEATLIEDTRKKKPQKNSYFFSILFIYF